MGTWGVKLFENDISLDIRGDYEQARRQGLDVAAATRLIMDEYEESLADTDEGPLIWLALAALQLDEAVIDAAVRREAMAVLNAEADLDRWREESSDADAKAREIVLSALRARLEHATPID